MALRKKKLKKNREWTNCQLERIIQQVKVTLVLVVVRCSSTCTWHTELRKKERKKRKENLKRGSGLNVKNKGSGLCCRDDDDAFFFILGFFFANGKQKEARTHVRVVEIKPQRSQEQPQIKPARRRRRKPRAFAKILGCEMRRRRQRAHRHIHADRPAIRIQTMCVCVTYTPPHLRGTNRRGTDKSPTFSIYVCVCASPCSQYLIYTCECIHKS